MIIIVNITLINLQQTHNLSQLIFYFVPGENLTAKQNLSVHPRRKKLSCYLETNEIRHIIWNVSNGVAEHQL